MNSFSQAFRATLDRALDMLVKREHRVELWRIISSPPQLWWLSLAISIGISLGGIYLKHAFFSTHTAPEAGFLSKVLSGEVIGLFMMEVGFLGIGLLFLHVFYHFFFGEEQINKLETRIRENLIYGSERVFENRNSMITQINNYLELNKGQIRHMRFLSTWYDSKYLSSIFEHLKENHNLEVEGYLLLPGSRFLRERLEMVNGSSELGVERSVQILTSSNSIKLCIDEFQKLGKNKAILYLYDSLPPFQVIQFDARTFLSFTMPGIATDDSKHVEMHGPYKRFDKKDSRDREKRNKELKDDSNYIEARHGHSWVDFINEQFFFLTEKSMPVLTDKVGDLNYLNLEPIASENAISNVYDMFDFFQSVLLSRSKKVCYSGRWLIRTHAVCEVLRQCADKCESKIHVKIALLKPDSDTARKLDEKCELMKVHTSRKISESIRYLQRLAKHPRITLDLSFHETSADSSTMEVVCGNNSSWVFKADYLKDSSTQSYSNKNVEIVKSSAFNDVHLNRHCSLINDAKPVDLSKTNILLSDTWPDVSAKIANSLIRRRESTGI